MKGSKVMLCSVAVLLFASCSGDGEEGLCGPIARGERANVPEMEFEAELIVAHSHGYVLYDPACPERVFNVLPWDEGVSADFHRETMEGLKIGKFRVRVVGRVLDPADGSSRGRFQILKVESYERLPSR